MKLNLFIWVLIFTSLKITSCNSKKSKAFDSQQLYIAEDFNITYSEGGGITGLIEIYHLSSSGAIEHFRTLPGQQDSLIWSKEVETTELVELQQSLLESNILNETLNEKGNMTTKLTYTTADTSYSFTWAGTGSMSDISEELKLWLTQLKSLLQ